MTTSLDVSAFEKTREGQFDSTADILSITESHLTLIVYLGLCVCVRVRVCVCAHKGHKQQQPLIKNLSRFSLNSTGKTQTTVQCYLLRLHRIRISLSRATCSIHVPWQVVGRASCHTRSSGKVLPRHSTQVTMLLLMLSRLLG